MNAYESTFWLCFKVKQRGYPSLAPRLAIRRPSLDAGEVAVEMTVALPRALFTRPALRARIEVPEGAAPPVISADVTDNIAAALSQQLGVRVEIIGPDVED